jgi:hypothetical protein
MNHVNTKSFLWRLLSVLVIAVSLVPIGCKARNSEASKSKNTADGEVSTDLMVETMSEIKLSLDRVEKIYQEIEANPSPLKNEKTSDLLSINVSDGEPSSLPAKIQAETVPREAIEMKSPFENEFVYDDTVFLLDSVVSDLAALKALYPEMSNRLLKEIDSLTESSSKLRSIIALPHISNSQSTTLQLEAGEKTLSLPQIRGQLSTLKAKINTVDSQVRGERSAAEAKERQARWNAHNEEINKKRKIRQDYVKKKSDCVERLRVATNDEIVAVNLYNNYVLPYYNANNNGVLNYNGQEVSVKKLYRASKQEIDRTRSIRISLEGDRDYYQGLINNMDREIAELQKNSPR